VHIKRIPQEAGELDNFYAQLVALCTFDAADPQSIAQIERKIKTAAEDALSQGLTQIEFQIVQIVPTPSRPEPTQAFVDVKPWFSTSEVCASRRYCAVGLQGWAVCIAGFRTSLL
jgi:hypothetical protein